MGDIVVIPSSCLMPLTHQHRQTLARFVTNEDVRLLPRADTGPLAVYETLGVAISVVPDLEKAELYRNDAFFQVLGVHREEAVLNEISLMNLVHPDDRERLEGVAKAVLEGDTYTDVVVRLKAGSLGYSRFRVMGKMVIRSPTDANKISITTTLTDVEEIVQVAEHNERVQSHIRLLEQSPEFGFFDWNVAAGQSIVWSDSHYLLMGYDPGEIESSIDVLRDHVHVDDLEELNECLDEAIKDRSSMSHEFRLRRKDMSYIWVNIKAKFFLTTYGEPHLIGLIHSVEEKRRAVLDAEAARTEMDEFIYAISHDLRAPIRHIDSFLKLLEGTGTSNFTDEQQDYLNFTNKASAKLGHMLDGLLRHNRLRALDNNATWVDLNRLLHQALQLIHESERSRVKFKVGKLPVALGVEVQLEQLLFILLHNAVKYSAGADEPRVEISFDPHHKNGAAILVADNGIGYDPRYANKVFQIFEQLHSQGEYEGIGVGLATAKRIIRLHGGQIWSQSEVNHGATFGFTLPRLKRTVTKPQPTPQNTT